jgi:Tfp pilus assembly protein PilF
LATVYQNKGLNFKAKQQYQAIINIDPNFIHAYHQLAIISFVEDDYSVTKTYL